MKQRFKRGNGEFLAAAVMSIFITSIMILIIAVMQMNFSMNNITKAVTSASRAAAVCATKANAETLTLEVAQASIENQNLSDIKTKVEYADTSKKTWVTGNQMIVTVSSHVRTMAPFLSGERSISQVITIEDSDQLVGNNNKQKIWNYLLAQGFTAAGAAGVMGNIQNEAYPAFEPRSLEFQSIHKSGINSIQYTSMVDNGQISRSEVISSSRFGLYSGGRYGYGLCGFTDPTIKDYLCRYTIDKGLSIGDLKGQLDSLMAYLQRFSPNLITLLKTTNSVPTAATAFLHDYERPANIGQEQAERTRDAQTIYQEMINSNS